MVSRHIAPETGVGYKPDGGGVEDGDRPYIGAMRARYKSVVHGVLRQHHW
jgi:hypothetical protein